MELTFLEFDGSRASPYRKVSLVLAFRSDDAFVFHKPWGIQHLPPGSWLIVPLLDRHPAGDVYGCHPDAFAETYRPSGPDQPHAYEKHATVHAYQPGCHFAIRTIVAGFAETSPATGCETDWLVRNPGGEIYAVGDNTFHRTYRRAE